MLTAAPGSTTATRRNTLRIATALGMTLAAPVQAQEAAVDIIVTARRVAEKLIDVPASVSVLDAQTITSANITDTAQAVKFIPGVTIVTGTAEVGAAWKGKSKVMRSAQVSVGSPIETQTSV